MNKKEITTRCRVCNTILTQENWAPSNRRDNRENLNPLHVWLIPTADIIHIKNASIAVPTISKWDAYALDINKVSACCDTMRGGQHGK